MSSSRTPNQATLTNLSIEGFRGFREALTLDLDASAVLLCGPNGTGKTSVFDALEWLLVGDVIRLRNYRLRQNDEYLVNTYQLERPARVEADFRIGGQVLRARRIGNARKSALDLRIGSKQDVGTEAVRILEDNLVGGDLPLAEVLATSGLLQQDQLRQLLQTKPDEQYRRLLRLLGLEVLERFDRHAASQRDRARAELRYAQNALDKLRAEAAGLKERLETSRLQVEMTTEQEVDTTALAVSVAQFADVMQLSTLPSRAEELAALGAAARAGADQIQRVWAQLRVLSDVLPPDPAPLLVGARESRAEAEAGLKTALQRRTEAREALRSAQVAQDAVGRLAAAALPLLVVEQETGPCPVCGSMIHPREVAESLQARAVSAASVAAAQAIAQSAEEAVSRCEALIAELRRNESDLLMRTEERRGLVASLRQALATLEAVQVAPPSPLLKFTVAIGSVEIADSAPPSDASDTTDDPDGRFFGAWIEVREKRLLDLERLSAALVALANAADAAAVAGSAARLAAERAAALPRQQTQFDEVRARLRIQEQAYEAARRTESAATSLAQRATAAAAELFRQRFDALEPLMNDIYARLDPHPAFKRLDFRIETYRARGTATANVVDDEEQIEANPMLVFSSAQANAVVLSAFLALGWAAGDRGLPFVLLDDPLQAMDDVNVLGFADLARRIRRQRQLVVATHEDRFASLLERKLTGRADGEELIVHRFLGWSRSGPTIDSRRVDPRSDLRLRVLAS